MSPVVTFKYRARIVGALLGCLLAVSCAHHGAARITSTPEGAEVVNIEDGTILGVTPVTVWWRESSDKRKYMSVRFKKEGYKDKVTSFWLSMRHGSKAEATKQAQLVEVALQEE